MSGFLLATALVIAFVAGSALSLRPSPRQRQLARLRDRAMSSGLRVQWRPGGQEAGYLLPWDLSDMARSRTLRFNRERSAGAAWDSSGSAESEAPVLAALSVLPASVTSVRVVPEGLQAVWDERGTLAEVERIARALRELGAVLLRDG